MEYVLCLIGILILVPQFQNCPNISCPGEFKPGEIAPFSCDISFCQNGFQSFTWEKQFEGIWKPVIVCSGLDGTMCREVSTGYAYTIADRATLDYANGVFYFVVDRTILEDSGKWRCKLKENQLSDNCNVIIYTELTTSNLTITPNDYEIIIGREYDYQCTTPRASPFFNTIWEHDGKNKTDGQDHSTQNELGIWRIDNRIALTHTKPSPVVTCYMDKAEGSHPVSAKTEVSPSISYYAAYIESFDSTLPNGAIKLPFELVFSCVSSGEEPFITWYKGSEILDVNLFDEELNTIDGSFRYGQTTALQSNLTWRVPSEGYTCADIDKYNGEYVCKSSSPAGNDTTEDTSKPRKAVLEYAPILKVNFIEYEAYIYTDVTLECEACASPNEEYAWSSANGRDLNHFFNMTQITLTVYKDDFNDTFYCTVENTAGRGRVTYKIYELVTTTQPPTTESPTTIQPEVNDTEETPGDQSSDNRQALIIANAVIWSLCGVVAAVLVFLALYHYRQIQEGRKYSDDTPLTENEAKPGTSVDEGEYADISFSSTTVGNVVGAVEEHNGGMYSVVRTPAQNPVAPKRTSIAMSPEQKQGTPKSKRTQAYGAPNSPVKARRQEPSNHTPDRRPEPAVDYSPGNKRKEMPQKHPNVVNDNTGAKVDQQRKKSPNQQAVVKPNSNGTKPPVSVKPNITSLRSSRSSNGGLISPDIKQAGQNYDNAQVNLYANCEQHAPTRNDDGTITYADLALQQEDPYEEGAAPVPKKHLNDQEPVQYASIKQNK